MLIDTNVLMYAVDDMSSDHRTVRTWLESALNGSMRIGMPWESLAAFVRIVTNPRAMRNPLSPDSALDYVYAWAAANLIWHPVPTDRHIEVFGGLVAGIQLSGNLISDAHLAAIAIEHGIPIVSADSDFALFADRVTWINPLR